MPWGGFSGSHGGPRKTPASLPRLAITGSGGGEGVRGTLLLAPQSSEPDPREVPRLWRNNLRRRGVRGTDRAGDQFSER